MLGVYSNQQSAPGSSNPSAAMRFSDDSDYIELRPFHVPSVYSPGPDEGYSHNQESSRYSSPKPTGGPPPGVYGEYPPYPPEGGPGPEPWPMHQGLQTSSYHPAMIHSSASQYSHAPSYSMNHPHPRDHAMGYHHHQHTMSPNPELMSSSGLPPMSTFRGNQMPPTSSGGYSSTPPHRLAAQRVPLRWTL